MTWPGFIWLVIGALTGTGVGFYLWWPKETPRLSPRAINGFAPDGSRVCFYRTPRAVGWGIAVFAFFAFVVWGTTIGGDLSQTDSHCASAAAARYRYVPGGPSSGMTDNFISRCESSDRSLFGGN